MPDNLARALAALPATVPRPEQCGETVQYLVCDARDVGGDVHGLLIVPAGTLGMDMGGGCSEKDNVACA